EQREPTPETPLLHLTKGPVAHAEPGGDLIGAFLHDHVEPLVAVQIAGRERAGARVLQPEVGSSHELSPCESEQYAEASTGGADQIQPAIRVEIAGGHLAARNHRRIADFSLERAIAISGVHPEIARRSPPFGVADTQIGVAVAVQIGDGDAPRAVCWVLAIDVGGERAIAFAE